MNIQELLKKLKTETNGDSESVSGKKNQEGKPYISLDDFIVYEDKGGFSVKDTRGDTDTFTTTGENVLEFFKGFYDACCEDYNEDKSTEFYDKGFSASMGVDISEIKEEAGEDENDSEDDSEEEYEEEEESDEDQEEESDEDEFEQEDNED